MRHDIPNENSPPNLSIDKNITHSKFWKETDLSVGYKYAKNVIAHHAKSFYFASQFLPQETRWATYALYSFCRFADNIVDKPRKREKELIYYEIDHLRQELELAYKFGESEHPALKSFIHAAIKYNIPQQYPNELLNGVLMDIQKTRYASFEELYLFSYRVAGVVGLMMSHVLGFKNPEALKYAEQMGIAMQLTNILRDIKEDKEQGRIYLPIDELYAYDVKEEDVINENFTSSFYSLMKYQVKRAEKYYEDANKGIDMLEPSSRFAIYTASRIYSGILNQIKDGDYNPFNKRYYVPKSKKLMILVSELGKNYSRIILDKVFENDKG